MTHSLKPPATFFFFAWFNMDYICLSYVNSISFALLSFSLFGQHWLCDWLWHLPICFYFFCSTFCPTKSINYNRRNRHTFVGWNGSILVKLSVNADRYFYLTTNLVSCLDLVGFLLFEANETWSCVKTDLLQHRNKWQTLKMNKYFFILDRWKNVKTRKQELKLIN